MAESREEKGVGRENMEGEEDRERKDKYTGKEEKGKKIEKEEQGRVERMEVEQVKRQERESKICISFKSMK